jgi:N-acetylglucosaminyldiphosphoundecaprenol N-acetyl-beta-D-mannosaminyltransferase
MGIAIRTLPIAFLGDGSATGARIVRFLGIEIDNLTMSEASAQIVAISKGDDPVQVCFVNADCVNIAFRDEQYMSILRESRLVLADGIGVRLAGMMLNQKIRENINGTDMLPFLCGAAQESGSSLYLLGGKPGVPEATARWIMERYPRLTIAGAQHGFFSAEEESDVIRSIASSGTNILLVALGAPIQEKWIHSNKHRLGVQVSIGVGGLFDFYSGRIPRAPIWLRELGCEWFYRFWREPRRMARRYLIGNSVFLFRLARERVSESVSRRRRRVGV